MAKKYFQAKKYTNNPLAMIGKKHPNSRKNRIIAICVVLFFTVMAASAGVTYLTNMFKEKAEVAAEKKEERQKAKEPPVKKVVKPLSDEAFKGEKEYNFYTQLEERSFMIGGEDRFGGIALDNIHEPPKITLESATQSAVSTVQNEIVKNTYPDMAPLVLESTKQSDVVVKNNELRALQVGSFTLKKDAEKHQKKLEGYGFASKILQAKNSQQQTLYRVYLGPFSGKEMSTVKARLNELGINHFEVK